MSIWKGSVDGFMEKREKVPREKLRWGEILRIDGLVNRQKTVRQ